MSVFQVLVSTMNQQDKCLIDRMNISSDAIVVNQINEDISFCDAEQKRNITWINRYERGLSKSRNIALEVTDAQYCLFADDDEIIDNECEKTIINAFEQYKDADIIAFQVKGIEKVFKKYSSKHKKLNFFSALKISSVQIALRTKSIKEKNIKFDERFGAGSQYIMGEENIFISDCLRSGLQIEYVPEVIASLHIGESSWNNGFNRNYFISRGAQYYRMSNKIYILLIVYFSIHIYMRHKGEFSLIQAMKWMLEGANQCKKNILTVM